MPDRRPIVFYYIIGLAIGGGTPNATKYWETQQICKGLNTYLQVMPFRGMCMNRLCFFMACV